MVEAIVFACGVSTVVLVLGIFFFVAKEAWPFLVDRFDAAEFFGSIEWQPMSARTPRYGALALFVGTAAVTLISAEIAVPLGMAGAIYLAEFSAPRVREIAKVIIELLAAVPSVVWGFIALTLINPMLIELFEIPTGLNVLNAGVVLAFMSIPIVVSIGDDALRAVPDSYREAAEALGATRTEVVFRVVLPAAKTGLVAAVLLGLGRAIGETMTVLMATGHSIRIPTSVFDPARTLTATIAAELGESPKGSEHYQALFSLGLALLGISFVINFGAHALTHRRPR